MTVRLAVFLVAAGMAFVPWIEGGLHPRACRFGCTWAVILRAIAADVAGVVVGRILGELAITVATFMIVAVAVLVHAWWHH